MTLVIVPTYNERDNLPALIEALLRHHGVQVLVVDDGSPDGTGKEADRLSSQSGGRLQVMHRRGPRGLGRSYIDGMRTALASGAASICQMDADFSHDPGDVPRLAAAAADADLVIGSRYVAGGQLRNWPWHRRVLSAFANRYVRAITRLPVYDATSGFRCWRRDLLARLPLDRIASDGYAFQVETTWHARALGARIQEVPITFVERRQGASKLSGRVIAESALLPWQLSLRHRHNRT
ncbi:MAG TPA: polyprenol monophosphomannose synthase [Vicinamibacterales bacterium]|nr:polyprenol monophosphomannose synthase [Vicinamibacterales bacterium]